MIRSFSRMVPQHTLAKVIYIQELFPDRLVSRYADYPYPPRSPDLTPPDAFLWGIFEDKCFRDPMPLTLDELNVNVEGDRVLQNVACALSMSSYMEMNLQ